MSDKVSFSLLFVLALIVLYIGFNGTSNALGASFGMGDLAASFSGGSSRGNVSLLASAASVIGGAPSTQTGRFLVSFDTLRNVYPATVSSQKGSLRVYDVTVNTHTSPDTLYVSTNQGLYYSNDTGLTWHVLTSTNGELTAGSVVLRVIPVGVNAYILSVFQNETGYVYYTSDAFGTFKTLMSFNGEGAYDLSLYGKVLYVGMSNGQLIQYRMDTGTLRVSETFSSPIVRLYNNGDGFFYVFLKSGALLQATGPTGEFKKISLKSGWFSSGSMRSVSFASSGDIYTLGSDGVYRSQNYGVTFELLDKIPLLEKQVDAVGVLGNTVYVMSAGRMYVSTDGGDSWKLQDNIPADFVVSQFYFLGGGRVILSE